MALTGESHVHDCIRIVVVMLFRLEAIVEAALREQNTTYYVGLTLELVGSHNIYKVTSGHEVMKWSETLSDSRVMV